MVVLSEDDLPPAATCKDDAGLLQRLGIRNFGGVGDLPPWSVSSSHVRLRSFVVQRFLW